MNIDIRILDPRIHEWGVPAPATSGAAGVDLFACLPSTLVMEPGHEFVISTGIAIHIGHETSPLAAGLLIPRSGLGRKGLVLGNLVGLIDADYQGEIKIAAWNRSCSNVITIQPGDRIAQLVIIPVIRPHFRVVKGFDPSTRGTGGFGSTGV